MKAGSLASIGKLLHGRAWAEVLSEALGIHPRSLGRMASGAVRTPTGLPGELEEHIENVEAGVKQARQILEEERQD